MPKHRLKIGYIGTSISSYFASEYDQRDRAIAGLEKLAAQLEFDLIAIADEMMTEEAVGQCGPRTSENSRSTFCSCRRRLAAWASSCCLW